MTEFQDPANIYLENNVFTASPQRLRLMLIEAGLRFSQQTLAHWQAGRTEDGTLALIRAQAVVSELHNSVRSGESDLAAQVAAMYLVLYRSLCEAQLDSDAAKVESVIRALNEDYETWRQLCDTTETSEPLPESTPAPYFGDLGMTEGLSLEA